MNTPSKPVSAVNPDHLRLASKPLLVWLDAGEIEEGGETMPGSDLRELLNDFMGRFEVDAATAVALFKRGVTLSRFCSETELSEDHFEEDMPGRELCAVASYLPVVDVSSDDEEELSHTFDSIEMERALRAARN
jgi:hypothetical protein